MQEGPAASQLLAGPRRKLLLRTAQMCALWDGQTLLTLSSRPLGLGRTVFFLKCLETFFFLMNRLRLF